MEEYVDTWRRSDVSRSIHKRESGMNNDAHAICILWNYTSGLIHTTITITATATTTITDTMINNIVIVNR